jgi:hypothetical protein
VHEQVATFVAENHRLRDDANTARLEVAAHAEARHP